MIPVTIETTIRVAAGGFEYDSGPTVFAVKDCKDGVPCTHAAAIESSFYSAAGNPQTLGLITGAAPS